MVANCFGARPIAASGAQRVPDTAPHQGSGHSTITQIDDAGLRCDASQSATTGHSRGSPHLLSMNRRTEYRGEVPRLVSTTLTAMQCAVVLTVLMLARAAGAQDHKPVIWTKFVSVAGQREPVPEQWLPDDEARIAHSLVLPDIVPKPVPYRFEDPNLNVSEGSGLPGNFRQRAIAYFDHLCKTEAGQWISKTVPNVEGLYFARPQSAVLSGFFADRYGPEMPWLQRIFNLAGDSIEGQSIWLVQPPIFNYLFVEQPRRSVAWQTHIQEPWIRLFGYTTKPRTDLRGVPTEYLMQKTPMQVTGISALNARFGYTWRGLKRPSDREHGIAGGEVLIYDLTTREVLAVRRQFLISLGNTRTGEKAAWEIAARCPQLPAYPGRGEFTQFAFDVLHTIEPSKTGK